MVSISAVPELSNFSIPVMIPRDAMTVPPGTPGAPMAKIPRRRQNRTMVPGVGTEPYRIFEIAIPDAWIGKTVGKLDIRKKYNVNIMALRHNGILDMNISSDTLLEDDQTMLVLGNMKNIQKQFHI